MTDLKAVQAHIDGEEVARIIQEFWRAFDGVYSHETMVSSLCAVGPLQAMIGLAIQNGRLALPQRKASEEAHARFHEAMSSISP